MIVAVILLWAVTLIVLTTKAWLFGIIPLGITSLVVTINYILGLPSQQEDRNQMDVIIDLLKTPEDWRNSNTNWWYFRKGRIHISDNPIENRLLVIVENGDDNFRIEANRSYRETIRSMLRDIKDVHQLKTLIEVMKA